MSQLSSREKSERALGKAVHPAAIERLYEIFPDAEVEVVHGVVRSSATGGMVRYTTVTVSTPDGDVLANTAWFYPPVPFVRRKGIKFAFGNLLKDISMRTNEANRALGLGDA